MQFYQYWIILVGFVLVTITTKNIIKTLFIVTRKDCVLDELVKSKLRNLYSSVGILSIVVLIILYLIIIKV